MMVLLLCLTAVPRENFIRQPPVTEMFGVLVHEFVLKQSAGGLVHYGVQKQAVDKEMISAVFYEDHHLTVCSSVIFLSMLSEMFMCQ